MLMLICWVYKIILDVLKPFMLCFVKKLNLNAFYFNWFSFFKFIFSCFQIVPFKIFIEGDLTFIDPVNKYFILAELKDHLHHHHNDGFLLYLYYSNYL